jgi:hypothetical protein
VKAEVEVFWGGSGEGRGRTGVVEVNGGRQTKPRKNQKSSAGFFFLRVCTHTKQQQSLCFDFAPQLGLLEASCGLAGGLVRFFPLASGLVRCLF